MVSVSYLFEQYNAAAKEKLASLGKLGLSAATIGALAAGTAALYNRIMHGEFEPEGRGLSVGGTGLGTFGLNLALGAPGALASRKKNQAKVESFD